MRLWRFDSVTFDQRAPRESPSLSCRRHASGMMRGEVSGGRNPEVRVITFGCRLNAFESEVMRAHAAAAELADTVIVNTCAVTAEAVRQAAQTVRKLKRENP